MTLRLRCLETADIATGMQLLRQAGWNQTERDWRRILDFEPQGCFTAEWQGQLIGTATTCVFGQIGWIAMVLVEPSFRRRGIGTQLVDHAMEYLERRKVVTARLDATPLGRPIYQRMGFTAEYDLIRFQGTATAVENPDVTPLSQMDKDDLDAVARLDRVATGTERRRLLERLWSEQPDMARLVADKDRVTGYAMLRVGSRAVQIGPVMAMSDDAGRALCDWACRECRERPVFIDVPERHRAAAEWAQSRGLVEQRRLTRMFRGEPIVEQPGRLWASFGPEKG